ncbi:imelysin family protein [Marinobacter psychrophilus]|uniref:imelysin family protein n=1 Tax=Marinobacter psychrophilus TaxID=330734 RepID=UPI001B7AA8BE|nr:imelysin family protein [Marinobacter psychrophilus]MBQ0763530.1 imelysin family protein [Marinobacter psychrophilus]MBQ0845411.1 imelysin family protein [Marinobacter psychrophilus]
MLRFTRYFRTAALTLLLPTLVLPGIALAASAESGTAVEQHVRAGWHQGIGRGYQTLASDSETLLQQAKAYCQQPSTEARSSVARNSVESAWKQAFKAWQQVRFVNFGPVETNNRAWQFQFWPDPKNLIARKADLLLKDGSAVSAETIGQAGVAVQGFPMLEYLLFDTRFNTNDHALPAETSCQILIQVAAHVVDNSQQLVADWGEFRAHYLATGNYTHATIRAAMSALEVVEERRLATPMGLRGNGKRSVYAADAWRSGSSLASIAASVDGLQKYFLPGLEELLNKQGESDLAQRISRQFGEVQEHFPAMDLALNPLLEDDNAYRSLQGLYVDVSQLTTLVSGEAATTLGVIRGFNSSDGD